MKREELKELGLTDDQINSVMGLHGKTVNDINSKLATAEQQATQYQEQLTNNQTELNALKESAKGNEELTKQLADLQAKFDETEKASGAKMAAQQKEFAIRLALKDVKALDEDIVLGQLDTDTIKFSDGNLQGLEEQLKALQENKAFLFQQKETKEEPAPRFVAGGNPEANQTGTDDAFKSAVAKFI